jgi:imidazolonepropionase
VLGLAGQMYGFSARELLGAATLNAAWTLDLHHDRGSLEPGKRADVLVLDGPAERIPYRFGHNPVQIAIAGGEIVHIRDEAAADRISDD